MTGSLYSQNKLPFGNIKTDDLRNLPYKPDPGADAIVLSDDGIASLNYNGESFYVELVRDVKIRIVNSNGYDYANVELPFSSDDNILKYKASTFNLKDDEKIETAIPKKSFIIDNSSFRKVLKFNFPDVHEGSVIEYSYTVQLRDYAVNRLYPWKFQRDIPVVKSSYAVLYPDYFVYKSLISGASKSVFTESSSTDQSFFGKVMKVNIFSWSVIDMPAYKDEPYTKSRKDNLTGVSFELASVNLPGSSFEEITPTYESLAKKLLEREDFGKALTKSAPFKSTVEELTSRITNDLDKLRKIHQFVSDKIYWNGVDDFTASEPLSTVFRKGIGNSADINLILIAMLRLAGIKADPVILSTRSNGSLNKFSAMLQQFNYVIARVRIADDYYLVDATDPMRPFNVLPFECLNGSGRQIDKYENIFVDLRNNEKDASRINVNLKIDDDLQISGNIEDRYSEISAFNYRKLIKQEGEEGYLDILKENASEIEIVDFSLKNYDQRDSDLVEKMNIKIENGLQIAGDRILFNPSLSFLAEDNPFEDETRSFTIDFGAPRIKQLTMSINIPSGYSVAEMPDNLVISLGKSDGKYQFSCEKINNVIHIKNFIQIDNTEFQPSQYLAVQDFYSKILKKQAELIVFRKDS